MSIATHSSCPAPEELVRASIEGPSAQLSDHLAACVACTRTWTADQQLREQLRTLPQPADYDVDTARARLMASATTRPATRPAMRVAMPALAVGGLLAAAAAVLLVVRTPDAVASRATLHPHGAVDVMHIGSQPDEVVRLVDGALTIEVAPLGAGERFRVVVGDAEIEVHGTAFDVVALHDQLQAVSVLHGVVEVHYANHQPLWLGAGEHFAPTPVVVNTDLIAAPIGALDAPAPATRAERTTRAPSRAFVPPPPPPPADATPPAAPTMGEDEVAFAQGWAALREPSPRAAADAFARVLASPRTALHEDASYWRAIALARAKDAGARAAFENFLQAFPSSSRTGEAAAALGWLLLDAHAYDEAAASFAKVMKDPSPSVRASAQEGLQAVRRKQLFNDAP